ncbi:hypothetical protein [Thiothrix fructosivorans]|jgi:hypothetical protein|uniref:Uncharacterized protein n=1 Tax=Thiothrix fructosivorans TaxID=111770 RepID=A0A8B0SJ19_9GAMM|nr:hypothetical protein [Thiothrix fructosivorans]MBO0611927.1 hypothetical protein [Thiothrix fructosivorans]QTX10430.1 hypothetical protein J1836_017920 [Thiothrix fructosivorans]
MNETLFYVAAAPFEATCRVENALGQSPLSAAHPTCTKVQTSTLPMDSGNCCENIGFVHRADAREGSCHTENGQQGYPWLY